ncbi:hypothetical protein SK128_020804, partial [Halocaridina rubra]
DSSSVLLNALKSTAGSKADSAIVQRSLFKLTLTSAVFEMCRLKNATERRYFPEEF